MNNKFDRLLANKKRAIRLAKECGWIDKFDALPEKTRKAFLSDGPIRIRQPKKDRKGFSKSKDCYGHFSGSQLYNGPRKQREFEAFAKETDKEIAELK
jgi:hypothetical protein